MKLTEKQIHTLVIAAAVAAVLGFSIILALLGINVYKNSTAENAQQSFSEATGFFTAQIRQCTDFTQIRTASLGGDIPALVITADDEASAGSSASDNTSDTGSSDDNSADTETWIYTYDNQLRKNTAASGTNVTPESGEVVMAMQYTDFRVLQDGLLEVTLVMPDGDEHTINLSLAVRGGE